MFSIWCALRVGIFLLHIVIIYINGDILERLIKQRFNPLIPDQKNAYSPYCSPYVSYGTSKENLSKCQDVLSLVITSLILITETFEQVAIMKGEILF